MTNAQKIRLRLSQVRQRLNEISGLEGDAFTDEIRAEADTLQSEYADLETRHRAAIVAEGEGETRANGEDPDAEARERLELRSCASLTAYLRAALSGRQVDGAEAELRAAAGVGDGIPLELWDTATSKNGETRADAATGAPGTVGVNLDRIRPQVFANSIAPRLGIEMPRVSTGTYASATITTSLTEGSHAQGSAAEATAAGFTVSSVTPKRISARLGIRIEDVAAVGQANFEPILRENLSLVLSDALDDQAINGAGGNSGADLMGVLQWLTDPSAPSAVADLDAFTSAHAGGIDGLWASTLKDVAIVCGPATMELSARTFQTATNYKGEMSAATNACTELSSAKPLARPRPTSVPSSATSTTSATPSITSARTRLSTMRLPNQSTDRLLELTPRPSLLSSTPNTSRSVKSLQMEVSDGTRVGPTSARRWATSSSASNPSVPRCGSSTSVPLPSGGLTKNSSSFSTPTATQDATQSVNHQLAPLC